MKLSWRTYQLHLKHPFTIARGSSCVRSSVIVTLDHDGIVGFGEAAPSPRYGESAETVTDYLSSLSSELSGETPESLSVRLSSAAGGNCAARAAVDIAIHDWKGRKSSLPLWRLWGLDASNTPLTSFTIGIDSPETIEQKVREADDCPILKVKAGVDGDEDIVKKIRTMTDKPIRVDANEGWKVKELARDKILWLEEQKVEFVEQPMPADRLDDVRWLRAQVHIPLIADESAATIADLPALRDAFDGINIKLMKCGGIAPARAMIDRARSLGLKVMLGCMIESSVGIAAAMHLSPLADYADLDGNLLIDDDPFDGPVTRAGAMILDERPGLGVSPRK